MFQLTTLCCKILYEIKKIESGNDYFVERGFSNSSYFHHWNMNCVTRASKQKASWSRKPRWSGCIQRKNLKPTLKIGGKNGSMFSCKRIVFWERKCQMWGLRKWEWREWINLCFGSFFSFFRRDMYNCFHKISLTWDLLDINLIPVMSIFVNSFLLIEINQKNKNRSNR